MPKLRIDLVAATASPEGMSQTAVLDRAVKMAVRGEELGYSGIWVLEHHFTPYGLCPDALTMSAYMLGATSRLRVGTAVCVAPFHHPVRLAENVALVDQLSHGRLDLGLGRGRFGADFAAFGVDPSRSTELLFETTERLRQVLSDGTMSLPSHGPEPVPVLPSAFDSALPPMYVACESATTTEWAARNGLGMLMFQPAVAGASRVRSKVELYEAVAEEHGAPAPPGHLMFGIAHVADSTAQAMEDVLPNLLRWANVGLASAFTFDELAALPNYEHHFRQWQQAVMEGLTSHEPSVDEGDIKKRIAGSAFGTADHCVAQMQRSIDECGITHLALGFEGANDDGIIDESMTRFAEEVMPRLTIGPSRSDDELQAARV